MSINTVIRDIDSMATRKVHVVAGAFSFTGRFEAQAAPRSAVWLAKRLPVDGTLLHARWSGEAGWVPLGSRPSLMPENATSYPRPGQLLLYLGDKSEPELLLPYGACAFASKAGALAGNHVITLDVDAMTLGKLGQTLLHYGAQPFRLAWLDATNAQPTDIRTKSH